LGLINLLQNDALLIAALKRPVPGGAYGQSARGWTHSKTLARRSLVLINVKRLGECGRPSAALIWTEIGLSEDREPVYAI